MEKAAKGSHRSEVRPAKDAWPLLLIDANARVGQEPSELTGPHGAEEPNDNTLAFQELLQEFSICLPSSFEGHEGPSVTWTSPAGHRARLDYVGVPVAMRPAVVASWNFEVPLPREHEDHDAVAVLCAYGKSLPRCRQTQSPLGTISATQGTGLDSALRCMPPTSCGGSFLLGIGMMLYFYRKTPLL